MNLRTLALTSSALTIALALVGCSTTTHGMSMGSDRSAASAAAAESFNTADIAFVMQMIRHHEQAVEMADILLAKAGVDARVTELASKIKAEQGPEIVTMKGWLTSWGQPSPVSMDGMAMDGMMSESDMDALRKASGQDSSKLFLNQMIEHHQGAVDMGNDELTTGKNADALALAQQIVKNQTGEITTMHSLMTEI